MPRIRTEESLSSRYAPIQTRLWVPAPAFAGATGSPTFTALRGAAYWSLPDAATTAVTANVFIPESWSSFTCEEWVVGLQSATTGDVKLDRRVYTNYSSGDLISFGANSAGAGERTILSSAVRAFTTQDAIINGQVGSGVTADPAQMHTLYWRRDGSDAADTYAGAIGLIGVMLRGN